MRTTPLILTALVSIALAVPAGPVQAGPSDVLLTIAGDTVTCKCCISGPVDVCRECSGASCTCDFDATGLPRCTSSNLS